LLGEGAWCAEPQQAATPEIQVETVAPSQAPPPSTQTAPAGEGFMEAQQVKELLHRLWLVQYRINDLFSEVHPERWKMPEGARASFQDSFGALRAQMEALAAWRGQFDARPESMYLGFMTHASMDAILPRLDGVTRIITQRENASLGAQFSQAGNQLFDLQQGLQPYLVYLLRNQDQVLYAAEANLAGCETRLGAVMRRQSEPAKVLKNVVPDFKGRRVRKPVAPAGNTPPANPQPKPPGPPKRN
jgi:hypothetical protein